MTTPRIADAAEPEETPAGGGAFREFLANTELIVVILLGIVSIATAYASFEAGLYVGAANDRRSRAQVAATEAESLYLEANQQFVQDTQTILRLTELKVQKKSADPIVAHDASAMYDELYFVGVSPELDAAITSAAALDASDSAYWHNPQADQAYQASLYGQYGDAKSTADGIRADAGVVGTRADQLGFYTAVIAVTLFLLGIAAVVKSIRMKWILVAIGMVIFTVTAVFVAFVPFIWIG